MNNPFEILMHEHRVIEKCLEILRRFNEKISEGEKIPVDDMKKIIDFIRTFADKCHHGKEEARLFPLLEEKGVPREGGPIGVMLEEHEMGRNFVRKMQEGIELIEKGENERGYNIFMENSKGYVELLKNHIFKEDNILFVMGDKALSEDEKSNLVEAFEEVERELGEGVHEKFIDLIREMTDKYVSPF